MKTFRVHYEVCEVRVADVTADTEEEAEALAPDQPSDTAHRVWSEVQSCEEIDE